jgi:hypothetical protein
MLNTRSIFAALMLSAAVGGCGLFVPEKNAFSPDTIDNNGISTGGKYEDVIVQHIFCEVAHGVALAYNNLYVVDKGQKKKLEWLKAWGTAVTLTLTVQDSDGLNPGVAVSAPFKNVVKTFAPGNAVTLGQSTSVGFGATGSASASRTETIQFTYLNSDLVDHARKFPLVQSGEGCRQFQDGAMIESNLKIWQFIYDKAVVAANGNASASSNPSWWPIYNTFTEDITFTSSLGGSVTPTWKFARISADTSGTTLSATRSNTNEVIITLGPVQTKPSDTSPAQLNGGAQAQHNTRAAAGAISTATGQSPH